MAIGVAIQQERDDALRDIQNTINEYGEDIDFIVRNESEVIRNDYGDIKKKTQILKISLKAFPIIPNPTNDQLEHAGLRENADMLLYTSKQDWTDNSIEFKSIDRERSTVKIYDDTYEIKEKTKYSQFANDYLYYTFGLSKK